MVSQSLAVPAAGSLTHALNIELWKLLDNIIDGSILFHLPGNLFSYMYILIDNKAEQVFNF